MSVKVMSLVYGARLGSGNLKTVAVKLADYANDAGGNVWPALETVACLTEVSKSTVQRSVKKLLEMGVLELESGGGNGPGHTTRYRFNLTKMAELPRLKEEDSHPDHLNHNVKVVTQPQKGGHPDHQSIKEPSREEDNPLPPKGGSPSRALVVPGQATPAKRASQLPDSFIVPDNWREWAANDCPSLAGSVDREAARFADHFRSTGKPMKDWGAAWRNWWRKSVDMAGQRGRIMGRGVGHMTNFDRKIEGARRCRQLLQDMETEGTTQ